VRLVGYRKAIMGLFKLLRKTVKGLLKFPLKLLAATGWFVFGCLLVSEKFQPKRVSHYGGIEGCKKAAISGDVQAQFTLGYAYQCGQSGLPQDDAESAKWYRKAAEQNHGIAQLNLGVCLAEGKGVEKNVVEGLMWLHLAQHVLAQNCVGMLVRDATYQAQARLEAQMTEQQIADAEVMLDSSPLYKPFKEMLSDLMARSDPQTAPEKSPPAQP
jgi:TPR repeat protein